MSLTEIVQILAAMIGSLGFAILFNVRGSRLVAVSLGGGAAWALFLLLGFLLESEVLRYFLVALTVSLYAELMARIFRSSAIVFITPCLIPLVPGASLYYTMTHALGDNLEGFLEKGGMTLKMAAALAVGIIASVVLVRTFVNAVRFLKEKRNSP